ncbi:MAG: response regulator transcription factor [Actinobacteria bacterium]|nr:MAG: response regulator transcription factor [Actinomycetota bacterium]
MEDRIRVSVVDDHIRLVESLRLAWGRGSRLRVLGPFVPGVAALRAAPDVIVVDLERDDGHGLGALVEVCDAVRDVRVIAATTERDPELGSAIVTAGASGLLPSWGDPAEMEDAIRRAVAGELVLPDDHLSSLVDRLRAVRARVTEAANLESLTARELEVLRLLSDGRSTVEIAALLGISPMTVQSHVKNVLAKLRVHSKVEAVRLAWRFGAIAMPASA